MYLYASESKEHFDSWDIKSIRQICKHDIKPTKHHFMSEIKEATQWVSNMRDIDIGISFFSFSICMSFAVQNWLMPLSS